MSRIIHRHWPGNPDAPSRRGRGSCDYESYVPDLLNGRHFTLDGDIAADVTAAETAITRLNAEALYPAQFPPAPTREHPAGAARRKAAGEAELDRG